MHKKTEALKLAEDALKRVRTQDMELVQLSIIALAAIREALAEQAQQKPFGYIKPGEGDYEKVFSWNRNERNGYTQAVYTTPPQRTWVGLTEKEMNDITCGMVKSWVMDQLARTIEAKLREKNT